MMMKLLSLLRRPIPAALVAFGACLLHYWLTSPVYEAAVTLEVPPSASAENGEEDAPKQIPADIFELAIEIIDSERAKAGEPLVNIESLAKGMTIASGEEVNHVKIGYLSVDQTEATEVLGALAEAYIENSRELKSREALPLIKKLRQRAEDYQSKLEEHEVQLAALQEEISLDSTSPTSEASPQEWLKAFSTELAKVRSDRLRAEARYRDAANELQTGSPVRLVAAQLSSGPSKEIVQAVLSHADLVDELKQLRATKQQLSKVYGIRHPRMIELAERELTLTQQLNSTRETSSDVVTASAHESLDGDRRSLLLKSLELEWRRHLTAEEDMQEQYELQQATLARHGELRDRLQQAKQEESKLRELQKTVAAKLKQTHERYRARASVVMPPTVAQEPVSPSLSSHLIWGGLMTALLIMLTHWAFRDLGQAQQGILAGAASTEEVESPATLKERRLARLAKLKPQPEQ